MFQVNCFAVLKNTKRFWKMLKKIYVFWGIKPSSLLKVNQHFRGTCCHHHQGQSQTRNQHEVSGFLVTGGATQEASKLLCSPLLKSSYVC
jgi:hypothetical protein